MPDDPIPDQCYGLLAYLSDHLRLNGPGFIELVDLPLNLQNEDVQAVCLHHRLIELSWAKKNGTDPTEVCWYVHLTAQGRLRLAEWRLKSPQPASPLENDHLKVPTNDAGNPQQSTRGSDRGRHSDLWQSSLQTLHERFLAARTAHGPVLGLLMHADERNEDVLKHPPHPNADRLLQGTWCPYSLNPLIIRRDMYGGDQKSIFEFWRLAEDAGRAILGLGVSAWTSFPMPTLLATHNRSLWIWTVFDLAWQQRQGSPLHAVRKIWEPKMSGYTTFPYDRHQLEGLARLLKTRKFLAKWAKELPNYYCSIIEDMFTASTHGLDVLMNDKATRSFEDPYQWARQMELVRATSQVLDQLNAGVLSKACQQGEIITNNVSGRGSRVHVDSFLNWLERRRSIPKYELDQVRNAVIGEIRSRKK